MTAAITARHLAVQFHDHYILNDLSLEIRPSEIASLVGPSGCGKSTLLRLISGLERSHTGELNLSGRAITGPSRRVGFMFQEPRLLPWLSVRDNIALGLPPDVRRDKRAAHDRIDELLAQVHLREAGSALPRELSGGMAQRAALARALAGAPEVLLLDEPFSAVDALTRMHLQDLVLEVARRTRITMLVVSHDLDEALYLSDRIFVLSDKPATVVEILTITAPRPRDRGDQALAHQRRRLLDAIKLAGLVSNPFGGSGPLAALSAAGGS